MACSLWALWTLGFCFFSAIAFVFFFLSVSYFFYARSANVVFSSKISLNVLCDSAKPKLTNQQATVHSELSISLASYLIKKWIKDSQLAAHLFLPLIKKNSSLWIFWFSDPRRHRNTLSVVSRENPCHSHSSDEGKKNANMQNLDDPRKCVCAHLFLRESV